MPSPSISSSDTSGVPSPSKSRCTTTGMVSLTVSSPFVMTTGILTVLDVSSPVHVIPVGVPVTLPLVPSIVKPFVGVGVTVVPGLFGLMTFSLLVYGCPSTAGFVGVTLPDVNGLPTCVPANSLVNVVVPLVTCAVIGDSSFTCAAVNVTFPVASTGIVESELVHVPFVALVSVNVLDVPSSALYEIVAVPFPVNSGVISTLPFSFALITGFLGATLSVTSTFSLDPSL